MKRAIYLIVLLLFLCGLLFPLRAAYAAPVQNLIPNPSAETKLASGAPAAWKPNTWGTSKTTLSTTTSAENGAVALTIHTTSRTSGDAKWMSGAASVISGHTYSLSDYSKASVATEIDAAYTSASGAVSYYYLMSVQPSTTWQKNVVNLTVPANQVKISILHILSKAGTLTTDNYSLTDSTVVAPPAPTDGNLMLNPSAETLSAPGVPFNWTPNTWGASTTKLSTTSDAEDGSLALTISSTARTNGDAKWVPDPVSVTAGHTYTFSDYSKASVASEIDAAYTNTGGTVSYVYVATVQPSTTWQKNTTELTVPAGAVKVSLLHILPTAGTLTTDNYGLIEQVTPIAPSNLIVNPSVETASGDAPAGWITGGWGNNDASFTYITTGGYDGKASIQVRIGNYTSGSAYWVTASSQSVTSGQLYDYCDYYQSSAETEVDANVTFADGSQADVWLGSAFASPNGWTKFETQFTAPAGAVSVTLYHHLTAVGYLTTDNFSLTPFTYQGFGRAIVSVTDDDGFANFYTNGLPILQKYGLPATAYIISGYLGASQYMTAQQVMDLSAAGVEIGSHSVDHPDLTTLTSGQQLTELQTSQATLQNLLGKQVLDYAAPYGTYNQQVIGEAANYYQSYRSTDAGYNAANNFDLMNLRVQNIINTTTLAEVQSWLQEAKATHTWLILVYHQINANTSDGGEYNTAPADFDAQMAAVKASGIATETISQAINELRPQL